jgi:hypothetical protein
MGDLAAFDEPQKLINWAIKAIDEAGSARFRYLSPNNFDVFIETDPQTGNEVRKYRLKEAFPPCDFARKCTEALNNLRTAATAITWTRCVTRPPWPTWPDRCSHTGFRCSG